MLGPEFISELRVLWSQLLMTVVIVVRVVVSYSTEGTVCPLQGVRRV